jgi:hypothetical protein
MRRWLEAKRDRLQAELARINRQLEVVDEIGRDRAHGADDAPMGRRSRVAGDILLWAEESGKGVTGFAAEEARDHLLTRGYKWRVPYNNTYEALRRLIENGRLVREGEPGTARFYLPGFQPSKNDASKTRSTRRGVSSTHR